MTTPMQHLQSEKQVVEEFLRQTPEEEVLERNSWLARLQSLDAQIEAEQTLIVPARSAITFEGRPVVGSHGVASTFGLAATRAYTKIVQVVAAQWERAQPLAHVGRLKDSVKFDLLVVGPAFGSFGFELEEPVAEQLTLEERSVLERALEKTQEILAGALESDEALSEALRDVDERVLTVVRAFLRILDTNDATCAIRSGGREFRLRSDVEVNQSRVRLEFSNIRREEKTLEGQFIGARPGPHDFEFQVEGSGEAIAGRINPAVADVGDINRHLYQRARARLFVQQVGTARPRYVLMQDPDWLE